MQGVNVSGLLLPAGVVAAIASRDLSHNFLAGFFLMMVQPFRQARHKGVQFVLSGQDGLAHMAPWIDGPYKKLLSVYKKLLGCLLAGWATAWACRCRPAPQAALAQAAPGSKACAKRWISGVYQVQGCCEAPPVIDSTMTECCLRLQIWQTFPALRASAASSCEQPPADSQVAFCLALKTN